MDALISLLALLAAWWPVRWLRARRVEHEFARANPRGQDGFIIGASPVRLEGTRAGAVLILHGFNDSPQAVASLAQTLHGRGFSIRAPVLPGHARSLSEFAAASAADWIAGARAELLALRSTHSVVAVGGLSMGGAIAFLLAAEEPAVRAVVAFAPYLHTSAPLRLMRVIAPLAAIGARYVSSGGERSIRDAAAAAAMIAYRRATPRLLVELAQVAERARAALPRVRQPVLVFQSREDNRIPPDAAADAFARIGSAEKTLVWVSGAGHVLTVDTGHDAIESRVADWLERRLR